MVSEKENLMGHCQKEVEMAFEATEFVAEPLPPNESQEVVWLTHLSRTITMGMQSLSRATGSEKKGVNWRC